VLSRLVTDQSIKGQLQARITRLRDRVSLEPISATIVEQLTLTRLTDHYADILRLAGLVIAGTFIDAFDPGTQQGVTTLIDMNRIYERVVERCAQAVVQERPGWGVRTQASTQSLVTGSPPVDLRPDFMIDANGETALVGDAKWKTRRQNSDIYQLVAYELAEMAPGLLVYPSQDGKLETEYEIRGGRPLHLVELSVAEYASDFETFSDRLETEFQEKVDNIIE